VLAALQPIQQCVSDCSVLCSWSSRVVIVIVIMIVIVIVIVVFATLKE